MAQSDQDFRDTIYYDGSQYYPPLQIIRNKRDSRFFPGNEPAGVRGITKNILFFIQKKVNPLGFIVNSEGLSEGKETFEDEYKESVEYYFLDNENDVDYFSEFE